MQVERTRDETRKADHRQNLLQKIFGNNQPSVFDRPEPFHEEKLEEYLKDPSVKGVHIFKSTPQNLKFAELRHKYPNHTRKQLRKLMKRKFRNDGD